MEAAMETVNLSLYPRSVALRVSHMNWAIRLTGLHKKSCILTSLLSVSLLAHTY